MSQPARPDPAHAPSTRDRPAPAPPAHPQHRSPAAHHSPPDTRAADDRSQPRRRHTAGPSWRSPTRPAISPAWSPAPACRSCPSTAPGAAPAAAPTAPSSGGRWPSATPTPLTARSPASRSSPSLRWCCWSGGRPAGSPAGPRRPTPDRWNNLNESHLLYVLVDMQTLKPTREFSRPARDSGAPSRGAPAAVLFGVVILAAFGHITVFLARSPSPSPTGRAAPPSTRPPWTGCGPPPSPGTTPQRAATPRPPQRHVS